MVGTASWSSKLLLLLYLLVKSVTRPLGLFLDLLLFSGKLKGWLIFVRLAEKGPPCFKGLFELVQNAIVQALLPIKGNNFFRLFFLKRKRASGFF